MPTPNLYVYQETSIDFTPFLTKWIPYSSKFLTAGSTMLNKGRFEIFQVERDKITKLSSDDCPNPIRCGTFDFSGCNESKIAFGCTDGSLEIRDMRSNRAAEFSKNVSKSPINCIDAAGDKSSGAGLKEIATGYKDGSICVWDPRVQDPVIELRPETDIGDPLSECWAIAFGNSHSSDGRYIASGFENGDLKIFDLNMTKIWRSDKLESGICSLAFDRKCIARNKLYLGSLEGGIYAMDLKTWSEDESVKRIRGEFRFKSKSTVWQVSVLPQCREILLNSMGDGTLTLWNFESSLSSEKNLTDKNIEQFGKLKYIQNAILSQQPICSFDCHRIKEGFIVLSSIDQSIKVVVATQLKSMIY